MKTMPEKVVILKAAFLLALLFPLVTQAATIRSWGRSVQLGALRDYDPVGGWYDILFTTTDSVNSNVPRYYTSNGFYYVSTELKQSSSSSYFETEYLVYYESAGIFGQWGAVSMTLPITDANGNGFPDWMERDQPASFTANGTMFVDYPISAAATYPVVATFTRSAGNLTGTYSLKVDTSPTLYGTWSVLYAEGTVTINRSAGTVAFSVTGAAGTRTATASMTLQGSNQVTVAPFTSTGAGKPDTSTVGDTILFRNGNTYRGEATSTDGLPDTPWADFTRSRWEVTDNTDGDGDGVPDLSDAILSPPTIYRLTQTARFDFPVTPGFTYRILTSTDLRNWTEQATHTASSATWQFTPPLAERAFFRILSP